jgi:curved DNA-binding protein CbpA
MRETYLLLFSSYWNENQNKYLVYRKAYKQLAKEWHPDKNPDENAQNKFVEINRAYELLSDPERRKEYDNYGITEDTPNFRFLLFAV